MKYFLVPLLAAFLAACSGPAAPQATVDEGARIAAAYVGTYDGVLPCANCEGIDTELSLNADGTFALIEFYLSEEADLYLTEGSWQLDPEAAYAILTPADMSQGAQNIYYTLLGADLRKLDSQAGPIESTLNYTLKRK